MSNPASSSSPSRAWGRSPRLSLNAIGKYLDANAVQRLRILRSQKFPDDYRVVYYEPAAQAIKALLVNGEEDRAAWLAERQQSVVESLLDAPGADRAVRARMVKARSNAKAIESALSAYKNGLFDGLEFEPIGRNAPKVQVSGMAVSIRPDLKVRATDPRKKKPLGILKLYISATPLSATAADAIASYLRVHARDAGLVEPELLGHDGGLLFDPRGGQLVRSPRAWKSRAREIGAICTEAAAVWPGLQPA